MSIPKITITINADSPEDFRKILLGLINSGAQSVTTINQVTVQGDNPDKVAEQLAESAKKDKAKPAATKPKDEPKPEPKLVDPAKEFADEPKAAAPAPAKPEPEKKAAPAKKAAAEPAPSGPAPELPDNIKNTNSMRDLLTYLAEHGVDSADAMVASCVVLKKDVPILSKVPNVEERVRRALDVLALFPAPEAQAQA